MNRNPAWRYALVIVMLAFGLIYAAPNLFGADPAIQITDVDGSAVTAQSLGERVDRILRNADLKPAKALRDDAGKLVVVLSDIDEQLAAADALSEALGDDFYTAQTTADRVPAWLTGFGARPMVLGLDLRGGVHLLMQVDVDAAHEAATERYLDDVPLFLRGERINGSRVRYERPTLADGGMNIRLRDVGQVAEAVERLRAEFEELAIEPSADDPAVLRVTLNEEELDRIEEFAVKQNLTTLRARVNQFGVAEPVVQRQGADRIVVQLPGIQDPGGLKKILNATATLEYRAVAEDGDPERAARVGYGPLGTELFYERGSGRPVLLKRKVIATGADITGASPTIDSESGSPAVSVTLGGQGGKSMYEFTSKNVGKPMAVVFKEQLPDGERVDEDGRTVPNFKEVEEVISIATIQGVFSRRFQTTGLDPDEARILSELLRAGALAAPVAVIEERTVGPSLGADNIERGEMAVGIGFILVVLFMAVWYKVFGLIANAALLLNLVLIVAVLSLLQATLTLPGIAGILLTVGMAVDANVLIFQRIREELAAGAKPQEAITGGYDKAFSTIADANITTFIAALVLFVFGTGPIQGFAVTLAIGIAASMLTAIIGTRVVVNLLFGGRQLNTLPI